MSKNIITGLFAVVVGIFYTVMALNIPHLQLGDPLGPKVFPLLIGISVILLGAVLMIKERFTEPSRRQILHFKLTQDTKTLINRIGLTSIFGILYGFLLDPLGYLLSSTLFMIMIMFLVNKLQRVLESILVSVGFSLITYVGFGVLLKLSLPRGILYF